MRKLSYWQKLSPANSLPLEKKLSQNIPDEVQSFLELWRREKYIAPFNKKLAQAPDSFFQTFSETLASLPENIKEKMNRRLKAIYLIDDIGASVFTIQLKNKDQNIGQFVAFFDKKILNQNINEWFKWREQTAFTKTPDHDFQVSLAKKPTVKNTIQYASFQLYAILLSFDQRFYPKNSQRLVIDLKNFPLTGASWKIKDEQVISHFEEGEVANNIDFIRYYSANNPAFTFAQLPKYYNFLKETNFINLYAFMGPSRDFVESIANYLYVEEMKFPFQLSFTEDGEEVASFSSCWQKPRCASKKQAIKDILATD